MRQIIFGEVDVVKVSRSFGSMNLLSTIEMNDIKQEDAIAFDAEGRGLVDGVAVVVDGATGFQKDIDKDGNIVSLPDITSGEHSSARIWADALAEALLRNAKNDKIGLVDILEIANQEASENMPMVSENFEAFQTPSATFILARVCKGNLEVIGSGDCGILISYKDGDIDSITGNTILENIRKERSERIKLENLGFDSMSKEEKAKITHRYMKETRTNLGNPKKGYFVPHYNGGEAMKDFIGDMKVVKSDNKRSFNNIKRGDIWVLYANAEEVNSVMMSSDGFIEKVLKNELVSKNEFIKIGRNKKYLDLLARQLREIESGSQADQSSLAMKIVNNKKANTGSADDAMAICFDVNKSKEDAVEGRKNLSLALASHYKRQNSL